MTTKKTIRFPTRRQKSKRNFDPETIEIPKYFDHDDNKNNMNASKISITMMKTKMNFLYLSSSMSKRNSYCSEWKSTRILTNYDLDYFAKNTNFYFLFFSIITIMDDHDDGGDEKTNRNLYFFAK